MRYTNSQTPMSVSKLILLFIYLNFETFQYKNENESGMMEGLGKYVDTKE